MIVQGQSRGLQPVLLAVGEGPPAADSTSSRSVAPDRLCRTSVAGRREPSRIAASTWPADREDTPVM